MLLLIDYSSMLYRAFHSTPASVPLNGVHGLLGTLTRAILERKPDRLALAVDDDWRPQWRVDALPMYKLQRVSEVADPVTPQEQAGRELLQALGFPVLGLAGYEAEDVIATLAERTQEPVEILSGDRDLFELVEDGRRLVLYPGKGGWQPVTESWIEEKYGIPGRRYGDFALLRGDPSDGLPGVPGIGEKTAASLISRYGSLDGLLAADDLPPKVKAKLREAEDYLAAARRVVLPVRNLPLRECSLELPKSPLDPDKVARMAAEYRLENALRRLLEALGWQR